MVRMKMSHWFRRGSIAPALLLAVYTLSIFSVILLKAVPAQAANATKADIATYNALVGFKKNCELNGGDDKKLTEEDYQNQYDNGKGYDDNGTDSGTQIVIGLAAFGDLGVVTCSFVSDNVAKAINVAKKWDLKVDNNTDARNLIVLLLSNSQADAVDYYKSNGSNSDPFRDGYAKINVSWSDFTTRYLDPAISLYRGKAAPQSAGMVASKLWMALNHCFYWGDKPFVNSDNYVNSTAYKLYGRKQDYGKYTSADFKKIIPNYSDRSGYTEGGKDKLGDIELGFEATDADVSAKFEVGSNWFPFGYDISLVKSGLSNPIISCSEMRSFFSDYASALEYDNPGKVKIKSGTPDGDPGNGGGGSSGGNNGGGPGGPEVNCSTKLLNPLTWFMCPLIELATKAVAILDQQVMDLLEIDVGKDLDEKNGEGKKYYESWSAFRFIALSLLVVIALVMVISQAFSFGIFDAYTIKKIAPRMLIAVIFIALSWPVTKFAVQISNDLGNGIREIITAPFSGNASIYIYGGSESILAVAAVGGLAALGALGILSFAVTALLAVLIAFFVLIVRRMLIFFLVILAPVAIICSILPNTQKVWKMWWDFFSKALLTFPIVAGMIAIGHAFASVSGQRKGLADQTITLIAYFGPYFIIPTAFKMAGGAIGQISGMVGDKSKGGFDRLRNFRGNQRKQKTQDLLSGNRLRGGNQDNFRGRVNRGLLGASKVGQVGLDPTRWRSRMRTAMNDSQEMSLEDQMKNSSFGVWGADDAKLHAARFTDRDQIAAELERQDAGRFGGERNRRAREDAVTQIERTQREMGTQAFHRARVRAQAKTGTGYIDGNGVFDAAAMLDDINMAYGSDRNGAGRALAEMRTSLTNSGQIAGQAGYGTWAQQMENTYNAQGQDQATRTAVHEAAHMAIMDDTIDSVAPGNALYGKPSSAAAVGAAHARRIQAISAGIQAGTHTEDDLSAAVAAAAGIYDAMGQASPGNASAMANELMGVALPNGPSFTTNQQETVYNPATGTPMIDATGRPVTRTVTSTVKPATVREYIEAQMNGNPEFVDRRRDLSQAAWRQAQQQQAQQQQGPQPPQAGPQLGPQLGP